MGTQDEQILRANFNTSSWAYSGRTFNWSTNTTGYVYICAASFVAVFSTDYNFFQSGRGTATVEFYNRSANAWQIASSAVEIKGNGTTNFTFFCLHMFSI